MKQGWIILVSCVLTILLTPWVMGFLFKYMVWVARCIFR